MRRLLWMSAVLGAAACGGLFVDRGNNFPCDFSLPEGERDQACSKGEVCGVDNLCRPYTYEGPQFEGGLRLPKLNGPKAELHPGAFRDDVRFMARNLSVPEGLVIATQRGQAAALWDLRRTVAGATVSELKVDAAEKSQLGTLRALAWAQDPLVPFNGVAYVRAEGALTTRTILLDQNGTAAEVKNSGGLVSAADVQQLRAQTGTVVALRGSLLQGWDVEELTAAQVGANRVPVLRPLASATRELDGGTSALPNVFDVRLVPGSTLGQVRAVPVALARQGIFHLDDCLGQNPPACWSPLISDPAEASSLAGLVGGLAELRADSLGRLWAFTNGATVVRPVPRTVLSTWSLVKQPGLRRGVELVRSWPDCSPCGDRNLIASFAPAVGAGGYVDVLCRLTNPKSGPLAATRVVGSSATDPAQACETAPVTPHFEFDEFSHVSLGDVRVPDGGSYEITTVAQDWSSLGGATFGGQRGRVWAGPDYDHAPPVFLDHVPLATGVVPAADGALVPAAATDRYFTALMGDAGFVTVDVTRLGDVPLENVTVRALASEAPGWGVLSSADTLQLDWVTDGGAPPKLRARFGPRLLDSSDLPAKPPYFAEAFNGRDGGLVSFVFTAFDSLYLSPDDVGRTQSSTPAVTVLRPDLTPEPNSPIRSFALERSVLGTDGRTRVRAYATTARNLYLLQLGGTPPRWTATQLVLTGEAPAGVWMDHPRGGLARVGYTSGEVYTLPGAFPLVRSLAASGVVVADGGTAVKVDQYENLGSWPVAYSKEGVFVAFYDLLAPGKYDNRFEDGRLGKPMTWKRVRLDDGSEPWLGKPGKVQVLRAPGSNVYELLVYTADGVWKVLTFDRTAPAD